MSSAFIAPQAQAWRMEVSQVKTNDTSISPNFTSVSFIQSFDTVPVIAVLTTSAGTDPASLRIKNVTTFGFDVAVTEPDGSDGPSPTMVFDYVAVEPGIHALSNGTTIAAGLHKTDTVQAHTVLGLTTGWDTVSFGTTLSNSASVVASLQTMNSETAAVPGVSSDPFMAVAMRNASTSSVEMAIERAESAGGTTFAESIGWIAFPDGVTDSFNDISSNAISLQATVTADSIVGWNTACPNVYTFSSTPWVNARVIASQARRDGNNGGWVRSCSVSSTQIGLHIDEDQSNDSERAHTTESANMLAFSGSFHAEFVGKVEAKKSVGMAVDLLTGLSDEYALPGARVRYAIKAQSSGNIPIDTDTVAIADEIPSNVTLSLQDINGPGSGPVLFTDGSPSSGLTYNFISLASLTDDLEFSNDGGASFTYAPLISATDVTHIRVVPKGSFATASGSTPPAFKIEFDAVLD